MQNISVRFQATTDFAKARSDLAALTAQVNALEASLSKAAYGGSHQTPPVLDAGRWAQTATAVERASKTYRDAASSSGLFTTQQIRAVSETDKYTKSLQQQKLTMGDMIRNRGIMKDVYNEQMKMQRATVQMWGQDSQGRHVMDMTIPKSVPTELESMRRSMGMFGNMAASAGTQVINLGKNIQWSGRQLMVGFTYPMALFGAAAGVMAYKVDAAFANINKVYDFSAAAQKNEAQMTVEQGDLRVKSLNLAQDAAAKYGATISSTLQVEQELAATGLKGANLFHTTSEVQRISTLGDMNPQETEKMVISLQTAFRKTIPDAASLTDNLNFMNAAANATSLSLQDIATAVPRSASAFASLGGTAKQMTVLLVAMRESGVEAAQGANALKSAAARALNPPSGAVAAWKQYGVDISDLAKKAGGNLFNFLDLVGKAEKKIQGTSPKNTNYLREQAIAATFGTYQFNRLNAALVNYSDAQNGINNQTSKAAALMKQTPQQLAAIAEASRKAMMDNPAGKFRQEWAQFQIELSKMGQPFLEVATKILGFFTKVAAGFNHMDDWKKKVILFGAGIAALAGPAIMITGLMLNMTGQFIKGVGAIAKFLGISRIYTKEQMASELAMKAQNEQLIALARNTESNISLTDTYARETAVLTESMRQAMEQIQLSLSNGAEGYNNLTTASDDAAQAAINNNDAEIASINEVTAALRAKFETDIQQANALSSYGQYQAVQAPILPPTPVKQAPAILGTGYRGESVMLANPEGQAANAAAAAATDAALSKELALRAEITNKTNAQAVIQTKTTKAVSGTNVMMGAMGLSMAAMMISSNKTVDNIAKWGLIMSIGVPALSTIFKLVTAINVETLTGSRIVTALTAKWVAMKVVMETAGGGRAGLAAAGSALASSLGAALVSATGLAAILLGGTAAIYLWTKHLDAIDAQKVKTQTDLTNLADNWGSAMGVVKSQYQGVKEIAVQIKAASLDPTSFEKNLNYYQTNATGKSAVTAYNASPIDKQNLVGTNAYINLTQNLGQSAKDAQGNLVAMLVASGQGFAEAKIKVQEWVDAVKGSAKHVIDFDKALKVQAEYLAHTGDGIDTYTGKLESFNVAAKNFAELWSSAFTSSKTPEKAKQYFNNLADTVSKGWKDLYSKLVADPSYQAFLAANNITSAATLKNYGDSHTASQTPPTALGGRGSPGSVALVTASGKAMIQQQKDYEAALVKSVATTLKLSGNIQTIDQLQNDWFIKARTLDYSQIVDQTKNLAKGIVDGPMGMLMGFGKNWDSQSFAKKFKALLDGIPTSQLEQITIALDDMAQAKGIKIGASAWQTYNNILNNVKDNIDKVKQGVDRIPSNKHITVDIKAQDVSGIVQTAMQGVQSDMVTSADNALSSSQSAAMNALQTHQQAVQTAMQNHQQAAQTAQDNRFKAQQAAITNSYQKRIDAIAKEIAAEQHADQIRQELYAKEKARIQQLADLQNNTIDFNMAVDEGRLQDAAKTLNTAEAASLQNQMDNELAAEQTRMQARVDALNKRSAALSKQRDHELAGLQKLQDAEKQHLQKIQAARTAALQQQQAQESAALQASQDAEKANLDAKLALFQAYVAKNQTDLQRWMKVVGLTYDQFGKDITNKGESWANSFQAALVQHIQLAGTQVASDNMWSGLGKSMATELLKGVGFTGLKSFQNFITTGNLPKNFGVAHHGGGVVGEQPTGRNGRTGAITDGERYILAEDGEMVVNKHSTKKYAPLLHAINKGTWDGIDYDAHGGMSFKDSSPINTPKIYKSFAPVTGIVTGGLANMFEAGVGQALRGYIHSVQTKLASGHMAGHPGLNNGSQISGYVAGPGGKHRPVPGGIPITSVNGWEGGFNAIDLGAPIGTPAYAIGNGRVISSTDLIGYEPRREMYGQTGPSVQDGYRSYGKYIVMGLDSGGQAIYAHLDQRGVVAGQHVNGGSVIGRTGNTGNVQSFSGNGAHLHFGTEPYSPYAFLRQGGKLKWDNTMVRAHAGETMLSAPLTKAFEQKVASGGGDHYDITIDLRGAYIKEDIDVKRAVYEAVDERENKKGRSKVVRSKIG